MKSYLAVNIFSQYHFTPGANLRPVQSDTRGGIIFTSMVLYHTGSYLRGVSFCTVVVSSHRWYKRIRIRYDLMLVQTHTQLVKLDDGAT